jgi:hypothetical protein
MHEKTKKQKTWRKGIGIGPDGFVRVRRLRVFWGLAQG